MHFILRTPSAVLFDGLVDEVSGCGRSGRFTLHPGDLTLSALMPGTLRLRGEGGETTEVDIDYGSLIADGSEVRATVQSGLRTRTRPTARRR